MFKRFDKDWSHSYMNNLTTQRTALRLPQRAAIRARTTAVSPGQSLIHPQSFSTSTSEWPDRGTTMSRPSNGSQPSSSASTRHPPPPLHQGELSSSTSRSHSTKSFPSYPSGPSRPTSDHDWRRDPGRQGEQTASSYRPPPRPVRPPRQVRSSNPQWRISNPPPRPSGREQPLEQPRYPKGESRSEPSTGDRGGNPRGAAPRGTFRPMHRPQQPGPPSGPPTGPPSLPPPSNLPPPPGPSTSLQAQIAARNLSDARYLAKIPHQSKSEPTNRSSYSTPQSSRRSSPASQPDVRPPPAQYIRLTKPPDPSLHPSEYQHDTIVHHKLLVLDLNGALVYRTKTNNRKAHPRPYLSCFLEYLFIPEPSLDPSSSQRRPWEVFVWSSAQPHNVRGMVESAFGPKWSEGLWDEDGLEEHDYQIKGEGRLLGVWARDKMGLTEAEYKQKTQTVKDLRKVIAYIQSRDDIPVEVSNPISEENTVLLDDSPLKGVLQPWSQIVIPEFDKEEYRASQRAVISRDLAAADAEKDQQKTEDDGLDEILLGVIGILEELRTIKNVPLWVRSGGLTNFATTSPKSDPSSEYPSHPNFKHWYQTPELLKLWIEKGKAALARKNISLVTGISTTPEDLFSPPPMSPPRWRNQSTPPIDLSVSKRYSPSRPASAPPSPPQAPVSGKIKTSRSDHNVTEGPVDLQEVNQGEASSSRLPANEVEPWRTFRAIDVASYLFDLADRAHSEQTQTIAIEAGNLLQLFDSHGVGFDAYGAENSFRGGGRDDWQSGNSYTGLQNGRNGAGPSNQTKKGKKVEKAAKGQPAQKDQKGKQPKNPKQVTAPNEQPNAASDSTLTKKQKKALKTSTENGKSQTTKPEPPAKITKYRRKMTKNIETITQLRDEIAIQERQIAAGPSVLSTPEQIRQAVGTMRATQSRLNQLIRNQHTLARQIQAATGDDLADVKAQARVTAGLPPIDDDLVGGKRKRDDEGGDGEDEWKGYQVVEERQDEEMVVTRDELEELLEDALRSASVPEIDTTADEERGSRSSKRIKMESREEGEIE